MKTMQFKATTIRAFWLVILFFFCLIGYSVRLFQIMVLQHEEWKNRSIKNHQSKRVLEMKRGAIYDRNGLDLAISVESYSVYVYKKEVKKLESTATMLASVLPLTKDEILKKLEGIRGYIQIAKKLDRSIAQKVIALNLPGVIVEENYTRVYPQATLASNLIGFCSSDGHGLEGIELKFDKTLRGYPGLAVVENVSYGDTNYTHMRVVKPPLGGHNITLTIDSFIQHIIETEIASAFVKYNPLDITAIAIDPMNGEILGMACMPTYDPNKFYEAPFESYRIRPVTDIFEPGSCMKIFPVALALESGRVKNTTKFFCKGMIELNNRKIKCHGSHQLQSVDDVTANSCNPGMVQISQMIDLHDLYRLYRKLGFGEQTGIELPSEATGIFSPPSKWSAFSAASLCIGQEIAVTGIQLVKAYSAIANGGWLVQPHLVKKIESPNKEISEICELKPIQQVFSAQLAHRLRKMLQKVVDEGTGKLAQLKDYTVGGKTSTAQKPSKTGGYYRDKVVTSFIGMAPINQPRVVLFVALNEPKGDEKTLYGGKIAAPIFAAIMDKVLKYLKVPPDKINLTNGANVSSNASLSIAVPPTMSIDEINAISFLDPKLNTPITLRKNYASTTLELASEPRCLPDVRGYTLRDTIKILSQLNLPVTYKGDGITIAQSPPPGTPIQKCKKVIVWLSAEQF